MLPCENRDRIDALWAMDTDAVVRQSANGTVQVSSNGQDLRGLLPMFDVCPDAKKVEDVFTPEQLDPSRILAVQQVIQDLQRAFVAPPAPASKPLEPLQRPR